MFGALGVVIIVALLSIFPNAPLRNAETGSLVGDSPLMDSLVFIIALIFFCAGLGYGLGAKTVKSSSDVIAAITKTFAGLGGLLFMLLLISQFIAYYNYSNIPTIAAVKMTDFLERANVNEVLLLIGFIVVIAVIDLIIPASLAKSASFAPIFVPLFIRLGVAPQTGLAASRVGDSQMNVITPLMVYLPFIVVVAQRYDTSSGVGTIVSLMLPYAAISLVLWVNFFVLWYVIGVPLGPEYGVGV